MVKAGCLEPYELRGSRTVLGARGGESPPRDSLVFALSPGGLLFKAIGKTDLFQKILLYLLKALFRPI